MSSSSSPAAGSCSPPALDFLTSLVSSSVERLTPIIGLLDYKSNFLILVKVSY